MNQKVVIDALMQIAVKRRLLGQRPAERLGEFARHKGIQNIEDLRKWLESGEGLSAHLANELKARLPKPGDQNFGPYIALAHLADGGMGTVWLACSPKDELVVVKTLKNSAVQNVEASVGTEFMKRFERESRITQQLNHPNVVRCLDSGACADRTLFMVLEYVDSGDLKDLIEMRGGLSEGLALAIMYQVVDGLTEAHRLNLIHRDIKPPNIFVGHDGRAKLADFGIARSTKENRTMLTMEGAIVGSPLYMSPEQIVTDPNLDVRSDIYAIGAVLYFCLAAAPPYDGKLQEILHKHCTASIPDIRRMRPAISEQTSQIIFGCMQKERNKRYADPLELRAALANALVKLGLTPGAPIEEETREGDLIPETGFRPKQPTADDKTIAANLNEDPITAEFANTKAKTSVEDVHTIAANLLDEMPKTKTEAIRKEAEIDRTGVTMAMPAPAAASSGSLATAVTIAGGVAAREEIVDGDLATALDAPWLTLSAGANDPTAIILFAGVKATLGKLREAPVDICLRNYPVSVHKDACQRISRQHLLLRYDAIEGECVIEDLGGANGTMLDGIAIPSGHTYPLSRDSQNILVVAGVISLWIRCYERKDKPRPVTQRQTPAAACGLDSDNTFDSIILTRPENRPELAYALVLRRLSVGGPGAQLVCAGARTKSICEIAQKGGRWIWKMLGEPVWKPLTAETELDCGGRKLKAQPGSYSHFD